MVPVVQLRLVAILR